jgi:CheY-like chemotaxis protein
VLNFSIVGFLRAGFAAMPMHIVQIEDESPLRDILKAALVAGQPTVQLEQFGDGESALEYIQQQRWSVDLFIIDIRLPGKLDGLEITRRIRLLECPGYVVLTSAYTAPPKDFLATYRSEYLPKPWHLLELTQKVFQYRLISKPVRLPIPTPVNPENESMEAAQPSPATPTTSGAFTTDGAVYVTELCRNCKAPLTSNLGVCLKCGTIVKISSEPETTRLQTTLATPVKPWSRGTANLPNTGAITLTIQGNKLKLPEAENLIIGRFGSEQPSEVLVDLSQFEALKHGVSRRHLKLHHKDGLLYITDLGSSNGTFLNDRRVVPYTERIIRNGDTLKLGGLEVRVEF